MTAARTLPPRQQTLPIPDLPVPTRRRLPPGRPRQWYIDHNRALKAMRLAIALLDSGVYTPRQAPDRVIRRTALHLGIRQPSATTCRMVRGLLPAGQRRVPAGRRA